MNEFWPWVTLFGLGAYHGINPGMGWLFAVALGMQEKSRRGVLDALPPIALGHALSIGAVLALVWLVQAALPPKGLRYGAAAALLGFGLYRLIRSRHPAWVGMRVGFRDLTLWSFIMASAHGAGLMLLPVVFGWPQQGPHLSHAGHAAALPPGAHGLATSEPLTWLAAVAVHSAGYLIVAGLTAVLVYEKFGLAMLRRAWINLDMLWVVALMASGVLILVL
ncbi:MAG: hypothetical protein HY650_07850 [Acidobacteria bacterium]|nr:hypothetical protein [Acidobacteriota bacterium]